MAMSIEELQSMIRLTEVVSASHDHIVALKDRIEHLEKQIDIIIKALPKLGR